ncbi:MAG: hypothetical protein D6751_07265 [Deltaproteobacteria bacterium]|nr:MAG: hypothetical protein D6751_07265 [Deltaproteobacteria bacterium]
MLAPLVLKQANPESGQDETSLSMQAQIEAFFPDVIDTAFAEVISPPLAPHSSGETTISEETLVSLKQKMKAMEEQQHRLELREAEMKKAEARLSQRVEELRQLQASIQQSLEQEKKIKNKKIKRLTAVYEGMKPERAAPVLARLELPTVVKVFLLMDEKKVGKILSFMPAEKAVQISQALTRKVSTLK